MDERSSARLKLDELAERAGVSPRTVRYYVQRGLLAAPEFRGPDTAYGAEHLARLKAIRALQARHLPLDAIQEALSGRTADELERIARGELPGGLDAPPAVSRSPDDTAGPAEVERVTRYSLAPGLELHITDSASPAVRALAEALRREAARREGTRR
jgi:DNA-binding transcriptional MerR regulator